MRYTETYGGHTYISFRRINVRGSPRQFICRGSLFDCDGLKLTLDLFLFVPQLILQYVQLQ
jgi:hypothetical protein